ncbi:BsuPI-related putative proteinase inhibitor [Sporohalobacter salinus]|uniref:BsuPI-related putative proteinase inhibitor n=1 Tax=Sporohalobacter salinus TaxID=1494606 RepID=UPI0019607166|nr:BsuPI-related putative proteinase inhibitor [Sporohalobacter salinus]MBM7622816.1 LysM repeat protein [Sporohalobacter salinus]
MIYRVKPGDTLYKISNQFGTTIQNLIEINDIENPDYLEVGQILLIPDGEEIKIQVNNFDYQIINGLLLISFTDQNSYQSGEIVNLNLIKVNISNSPIELTYSTSQRVDFIARSLGQQVWQWSQNRKFAQIIETIELAPSEALVYQENWNQKNNRGQQVEPGIYQITGWNVADEINNEKSRILIEIE